MGKRHGPRLIAFASLGMLTATAVHAACSDDTLSMRGDFGTAQFTVAVADTNAERSRGLMHVEEMAMTQGMLFVYGRPQNVSFWMRNTLIPLDMIFIAETGEVQSIHENAIPLDKTPIFGGSNIQYVLEINGGMSSTLGLAAGDQVQHPALGPDALWPCTDG